jgi:hypothetical protein
MNVWQRGTSFSSITSKTYTADRWCVEADISTSCTQQAFTPGTAPVAGYEGTYFLRYTKSAGGSFANLQQLIEDVRTFAGQTITISFWAKADSSISIFPYVFQNFGSGGSASVGMGFSSATITTSWARYSFTLTLPSIAGKTIGAGNNLQVYFTRISTASAATIDTWGVQVEAGSVATPFTTASNTFQGELALCQRYYQQWSNGAFYGNYYQSGSVVLSKHFPVTMRIQPTSTVPTATITNGIQQVGIANYNITSNPSYFKGTTTEFSWTCNVSGGTTVGAPVVFQDSSIFQFSAEL